MRNAEYKCDVELGLWFDSTAVFRSFLHSALYTFRKVFRIGTVRYNWPMSAHASQAFSMGVV